MNSEKIGKRIESFDFFRSIQRSQSEIQSKYKQNKLKKKKR